MGTTTDSVRRLAEEAYKCFETAQRDGTTEEDRYVRIKDGSPEWVTDLAREAHGAMFPDDWRYACIVSALECISESDDPDDARHEWADGEVYVDNGARLAWLASHGARADYCDEAVESTYAVGDRPGIIEAIGAGQYEEASEVFGLVLDYLHATADSE